MFHKNKLIHIIRKIQPKLLGHVMRREKLENLVMAGKIQGGKKESEVKRKLSHWNDHVTWKNTIIRTDWRHFGPTTITGTTS